MANVFYFVFAEFIWLKAHKYYHYVDPFEILHNESFKKKSQGS